jgi:hypothetical protein
VGPANSSLRRCATASGVDGIYPCMCMYVQYNIVRSHTVSLHTTHCHTLTHTPETPQLERQEMTGWPQTSLGSPCPSRRSLFAVKFIGAQHVEGEICRSRRTSLFVRCRLEMGKRSPSSPRSSLWVFLLCDFSSDVSLVLELKSRKKEVGQRILHVAAHRRSGAVS